jgi:DNA-binding GntR family transcriptional regulator
MIEILLDLLLLADGDRERSQKEHLPILDACTNQDSDRAIELLKQHIDLAGEEIVSYLQKRK